MLNNSLRPNKLTMFGRKYPAKAPANRTETAH